MDPNYKGFWIEFKDSRAWAGMMSMARYSPDVKVSVLSLRIEILDAINGIPNEENIQESIWTLMELISGQTDAVQVGELVSLMGRYGLLEIYTLLP